MTDDDSLIDSVRRTIAGLTAAERAEELSDRAREAPASLDRDEIDALVELLDHDDPDVVGSALDGVGALAEERPGRCGPAVPALAGGLTNRPGDEWGDTTLREATTAFLQDLHRGAILLTLAERDPSLLEPIAGELASKLTADAGTLEPQAQFALAHLAASDPDAVDVPPGRFVELATTQLERAVGSDDTDGLEIQPIGTVALVELLGALGDDDALGALEHARSESDDEEVVAAASEAIERLDGGTA